MISRNNAIYATASGREVRISNLSLRRTYANHLEGNPETISFHMRRLNRLSENMKREFPHIQSILVIDEGAAELPNFEWQAVLESGAIKSESEDSMSHLGIVWFTDTFDCDIPNLLEKLIGSINWEKEAEEFDYAF